MQSAGNYATDASRDSAGERAGGGREGEDEGGRVVIFLALNTLSRNVLLVSRFTRQLGTS